MLTYGKRMHLLVTIQVFNMHAVPCAFDPHKTYICQHSFSLASEPVLIRLIEQLCYMRSAHIYSRRGVFGRAAYNLYEVELTTVALGLGVRGDR